MKRKAFAFVPVLLLTVALLGVSFLSGPEAAAVQPLVTAEFVAERCGSCHDMDKTCRKLGKKDLAAWTKTVKRMVEARNADVSPAGVDAVAAYLFEPDQALQQLCAK